MDLVFHNHSCVMETLIATHVTMNIQSETVQEGLQAGQPLLLISVSQMSFDAMITVAALVWTKSAITYLTVRTILTRQTTVVLLKLLTVLAFAVPMAYVCHIG